MNFKDFGFHEKVLDGIDAINYKEATPVQAQVIPHILAGKDVITLAQTGTGKTAAFLLPIMHKLVSEPHDAHEINALIVVPTRELAIQIAQNLEGLGYFTGVSCMAVYGGSDGKSFDQEKKALKEGADIVICTPGRMLSHLGLGYVKLKGLKYLVLDEADRMLDMGFWGDIMKISQALPQNRQTMLFSATMPPKIKDLAKKILKDYVEVSISISKPPEKIVQKAYVVYDNQKLALLKHLLAEKKFNSIIIFCSRKENVNTLSKELKRAKYSIEDIHSGKEQGEREDVLRKFKNKQLNILVATDILSRGIDVEDIDLVINYDVPNDGEDYVHRIGRTARAQSDGTAYTFIGEQEQYKFLAIEKLLERTLDKEVIPEFLGKTPAYEPTKRVFPTRNNSNRRPQKRP